MIKPIRATGLERLEVQRLRDRVGRIYAALQEATEAENPLVSGTWAPPVDLCETETGISIRVELPGVTADEIKIGLTNTKLRIWGEKKQTKTPNKKKKKKTKTNHNTKQTTKQTPQHNKTTKNKKNTNQRTRFEYE